MATVSVGCRIEWKWGKSGDVWKYRTILQYNWIVWCWCVYDLALKSAQSPGVMVRMNIYEWVDVCRHPVRRLLVPIRFGKMIEMQLLTCVSADAISIRNVSLASNHWLCVCVCVQKMKAEKRQVTFVWK